MTRTLESRGPLAHHMPRRQRRAEGSSLIEVMPDIACLPLSIVNVILVGDPGAGDRRWALIDAGLMFSAGRIRRAAADRFGTRSRPAAIVLTHGHFDHAGAVRELADFWDAPIFAHELELPYLTGLSSYPPTDPAAGGGAMSFLSRLYPRGPIDLRGRVTPLPADGTVPGLPDWRWIHTPGHTAGHVALFREPDRALIAGDAFVTTKQESLCGALLRGTPCVRRPPAYFTHDWQAAGRSVAKLAELKPNAAVTGHGSPMYGERLRRELDDLARRWETLAVPPWGRYTREPAIADERGTVRVPPPVPDPQVLIALSLALAGLAGVKVIRNTIVRRHRRWW